MVPISTHYQHYTTGFRSAQEGNDTNKQLPRAYRNENNTPNATERL